MRSPLTVFLTTPALARAPILVYRAGLGRLLGSRLLLLEHIGRTSGRPRHVVLEVVDRPAPDRLVIASGFGRQAQWYRNLAADPRCRVSTGRHRNLPATATLLDEADSAVRLDRYRQRHPRAWRQLERSVTEALGHPIEEIPMVELTLQPAGQVPGAI